MLWMNILIFSVSFLAILVAVTRAHHDYKNCEDEMEEKWRTLASVVVAEALERETGARGVRSSLLNHIEDAFFELYSHPEGGKKIVLNKSGEKITWKIE